MYYPVAVPCSAFFFNGIIFSTKQSIPLDVRLVGMWQPSRRDNDVFDARIDAAEREKSGTGLVCQINNGVTNRAAKFHKTLPHDDLGQVIVYHVSNYASILIIVGRVGYDKFIPSCRIPYI